MWYSAQEELLSVTNAVFEKCGNKFSGDNLCVASYVPIGAYSPVICLAILFTSRILLLAPTRKAVAFRLNNALDHVQFMSRVRMELIFALLVVLKSYTLFVNFDLFLKSGLREVLKKLEQISVKA